MTLKRTALYICSLFIANLSALNIQKFSRSHSIAYEIIEDARLDKSHIYSSYNWMFNIGFSYVDDPLVVKNVQNTSQLDDVVTEMTGIHLGLSYYFTDALQLGLEGFWSNFESINNGKGSGFGDLDLRLKWRFYATKSTAFSIMPNLTIPLNGGNIDLYDKSNYYFGKDPILSDRGFGIGARLIYEQAFKYFQIALNLGYIYNPKAFIAAINVYKQIDYRHKLQTGFGMYIPVYASWGFNLEYMRNWSTPFFNMDINQSEIFLGTSFALLNSITAFGGLSFGNIFANNDGNDYRFIVGVKITPNNQSEKTLVILEDLPPQKPQIARICYADDKQRITIVYPKYQYEIDGDHKAKLATVVERLLPYMEQLLSIKISARANESSDQTENNNLITNRANTVYNYLIERGIPASLLQVNSWQSNFNYKERSSQDLERFNQSSLIEINYRKSTRCSK